MGSQKVRHDWETFTSLPQLQSMVHSGWWGWAPWREGLMLPWIPSGCWAEGEGPGHVHPRPAMTGGSHFTGAEGDGPSPPPVSSLRPHRGCEHRCPTGPDASSLVLVCSLLWHSVLCLMASLCLFRRHPVGAVAHGFPDCLWGGRSHTFLLFD